MESSAKKMVTAEEFDAAVKQVIHDQVSDPKLDGMKKFNAELMAHPEWYEQKSVSGGVAVYYGIMMKTTG